MAPAFYCFIQNREHRNRTDHTDQSKQRSEYQDGKQNPETFQTNRFSNDLRTDNISVHLLNDDDKYKEDHSFKRRCQKDKQRTWDGSDIWSKKWNDIGYADEYTDQRRVWNIRNTESNKGNDRYNDRVNDLSTENLAKDQLMSFPKDKIRFALFSEKIVYKRRFAWAQNRSFPAIR